MENISLTPEEVAIALNITKNTVYEMVKRGQINAYRIGRKIRIDNNELIKYKESMKISDIHIEKKDNTTFIISGQDIILDILCRHMEEPGLNILRSFEGSYNGLYLLYNEKVNVATSHLWDADNNIYNVTYVKSMLPGIPTKIITIVKRRQGFYVKKGNPKNITDFNDLTRNDIKFINRERGSGSRVLLDEHLRILDINSNNITGYDIVANSHISVASIVARDIADVGIGAEKSSKQIKELEFIPIQKENYDLIFKLKDLDTYPIQKMMKIIQSEDFRNEIISLGDYEL